MTSQALTGKREKGTQTSLVMRISSAFVSRVRTPWEKDRREGLAAARTIFGACRDYRVAFLRQFHPDSDVAQISRLYNANVSIAVRRLVDALLFKNQFYRILRVMSYVLFVAMAIAGLVSFASGNKLGTALALGWVLGAPIGRSVMYLSGKIHLGRLAILALILGLVVTWLRTNTSVIQSADPHARLPVDNNSFPFALLVFASGTAMVVILCMELAIRTVGHRMDHILFKGSSAQLFLDLIAAIFLLEGSSPFASAARREQLILIITECAEHLRRELPRLCRIRDQLNNSIYVTRCTDAATILRSYTLWVALPQSGTAEQLQEKLAIYARALLVGTIDDLPSNTGEIVRPTVRQRLIKLRGTTRILVAGAIPLGCVLVGRAAGVSISGPVGDALTIATVIWMIVSYVSAFDPVSSTRIGMIKDITGSVKELISK